jgi:hypothetical protein
VWGAVELCFKGEARWSAIGVSGDGAFSGFDFTDAAVLDAPDLT